MDKTYTYEDLKNKTVAMLREIASGLENEAVKGYSQLTKEPLLKAICGALGIETHEHHEVVGINKGAIKDRIQKLKKRRNEILASHDRSDLKKILRQIHSLKHRIRRATV